MTHQCSQLVIAHAAGATGHARLCQYNGVVFENGEWRCKRHSKEARDRRAAKLREREQAMLAGPGDPVRDQLVAAIRNILIPTKQRWRALPVDSFEKKCIRDCEEAMKAAGAST